MPTTTASRIWKENGIAGVKVTLTNSTAITTSDGRVWDPGDFEVETTTSDGSDGNAVGSYLFTALPPGEYTVSTDTTDPIFGASQTADPDRDGVTCDDTTYSALPDCDNADTGIRVNYGSSYMGADFGYQPPGVIGDFVWLDQNGDGIQDAGEVGLAGLQVTVTNGGQTFITTTDLDGYYSFDNLPDGSWTVTIEPPAGMAPSSGPESIGSTSTAVVVSGGVVTSIGGTGCTDCSLNVDLGFQLSGLYTLSGTICLDDVSSDGVCGTGSSGVLPGEIAFEGVPVYLYGWDDGGVIGVIEPGELTALGSVLTDANGDYAFTNLPDGDYITSVAAPVDHLSLTTTVSDTPAYLLEDKLDSLGDTTSAYQAVAITGDVENVDYAFERTVDIDFGDLPAGYQMTTSSEDGAAHIQPGTQALYLGTAPDTNQDGAHSIDADADDNTGLADEDGVTFTNDENWNEGVNGGAISVDVLGSGWLVGWIDFNSDGDFQDEGEMIVSQAVSTGSYPIAFDIPVGGVTRDKVQYARFRLFESEPLFPEFAYSGVVSNGEVEDYVIPATTLPVTISYIGSERNGEEVRFAWQTATETGNAGFNILVKTDERLVQLNGDLIASKVIDSVEITNYEVILATTATLFYVQEVGIDGSVNMIGPFQVGQEYGSRTDPGGTDPGETGHPIYLPTIIN